MKCHSVAKCLLVGYFVPVFCLYFYITTLRQSENTLIAKHTQYKKQSIKDILGKIKQILSDIMFISESDVKICGEAWKVPFNISEGDVIAFHHMQKTGGSSWSWHLFENITEEEYPCATYETR